MRPPACWSRQRVEHRMGTTVGGGVKIRAGEDRFERERKVFGVMPFSVKVSASDTGGHLLVIEQHNAYPGGPPRHVHHDQEEWFYAVEGRYVVEVAGVEHELGPGDSVLAPRGVAHTWALVGEEKGRLLIAFQPAGTMETFFDEACDLNGMPSPEALAPLFEVHGMKVVGPPLRRV